MSMKNWKNGRYIHDSKRAYGFPFKTKSRCKVTLTKDVPETYIDPDDGYEETYYEDKVTDLEPYCITVDVLGNGDVDIRWL